MDRNYHGDPDSYTVKYSPDGDLLWENTYAGSATGTDYGYALTLDPSGNVYVAGFGNGTNPATFDIFVLKYDADGNSVWTQRWTSPITNYSAYAYSMQWIIRATSISQALRATGLPTAKFITLKYYSSGVLQWATPYNGQPAPSIMRTTLSLIATGTPISPVGAAAQITCTLTTIKYDPDGNELWVKRYNGSADDNDYAYWLALDGLGNVYVAGQSVETGSDNDITTIKYAPNGDEIWVRHYDGPAHGYDAGQAIAVDADGNAYVTGNHTIATGLALPLSIHGRRSVWTASFDGPDAAAMCSYPLHWTTRECICYGICCRRRRVRLRTMKYDTEWDQNNGCNYTWAGSQL